MDNLVTRLRVNYSLQHEAADRIEQLEAELAALKSQSQEPVAYSVGEVGEDCNGFPWKTIRVTSSYPISELPIGTKVYAAPPLREGWVSVPREPSNKTLDYVARHRWPFGAPDEHDIAELRDIYRDMITASEEGK